VTGTIDVSIVTIGRLVLDVSGGDGDASGLLFGCIVDGVEGTDGDLGVVLG
jgi:hypothetical protein